MDRKIVIIFQNRDTPNGTKLNFLRLKNFFKANFSIWQSGELLKRNETNFFAVEKILSSELFDFSKSRASEEKRNLHFEFIATVRTEWLRARGLRNFLKIVTQSRKILKGTKLTSVVSIIDYRTVRTCRVGQIARQVTSPRSENNSLEKTIFQSLKIVWNAITFRLSSFAASTLANRVNEGIKGPTFPGNNGSPRNGPRPKPSREYSYKNFIVSREKPGDRSTISTSAETEHGGGTRNKKKICIYIYTHIYKRHEKKQKEKKKIKVQVENRTERNEGTEILTKICNRSGPV